MSLPYNIKDREHEKFQVDINDNTAVNVVSANIESKLDNVIIAIGGGAVNTTPNIFNVSCTASVEANQILPANTKRFIIKTRGGSRFTFSYSSGATETLTINSGFSFEDPNYYVAQTIYFICANSDIMEIVAYT